MHFLSFFMRKSCRKLAGSKPKREGLTKIILVGCYISNCFRLVKHLEMIYFLAVKNLLRVYFALLQWLRGRKKKR